MSGQTHAKGSSGRSLRGPELPLAERRRRRRELWISGVVIAAIVAGVLLEQRIEAGTQALPSYRYNLIRLTSMKPGHGTNILTGVLNTFGG